MCAESNPVSADTDADLNPEARRVDALTAVFRSSIRATAARTHYSSAVMTSLAAGEAEQEISPC